MEEKNEQLQKNENEGTNEAENRQTGDEEVNNSVPVERESGVEEIKNKFEAELKQAAEKFSELEKQLNEYKDAYLRKAAEFENYKRRNENEISNLLKYAAEPFIKSILTVYDDLERSLDHINDEKSVDSLRKGLELVYEKFTKILDGQGVKKIDAKGNPFDVELHEALMQQPSEGVPAHTVLDVIEQGYLYKDKVLRHAKVIVSTDTMPQSKEPNNENDETNNTKNGENQ